MRGKRQNLLQPSERVVFALVIGCDLQSTDTGLESLLMMTKKPKKPEKVDTIVGQMKGVPSSTSNDTVNLFWLFRLLRHHEE